MWHYTSRGKTSEVYINVDEGYAIKQFRGHNDHKRNQRTLKGRDTRENCFLRELECLRRLQGYEHFPQLLEHDREKLWIKMTYCGTPYPCKPPRQHRTDLIDQANRIVDSLAEVDVKYNYWQVTKIDGVDYKHLQAGNVNLLDDKLYLIDFEKAWPVGYETDLPLSDYYKTKYTKQEFKTLFKSFLVPTGDRINDLAFANLGNKLHFARKHKKEK